MQCSSLWELEGVAQRGCAMIARSALWARWKRGGTPSVGHPDGLPVFRRVAPLHCWTPILSSRNERRGRDRTPRRSKHSGLDHCAAAAADRRSACGALPSERCHLPPRGDSRYLAPIWPSSRSNRLRNLSTFARWFRRRECLRDLP